MRKLVLRVSVALVLAAVMQAAAPVASVSSAGKFLLRGASVTVEGIPSWPVMVGDEIATLHSPAMVTFRDGSQAVIAPNSRANVVTVDGNTVIRLASGSMDLKYSPTPRVRFFVENDLLPVTAGFSAFVATKGSDLLARGETQKTINPWRPLPVSPR